MLLVLPCWALISAVVAAAAYRRGLDKGAAVLGSRRGERGGGVAVDVADPTDITQEEVAVESVLSLWFDGSTADNHRTKWFAQV